MMGGWRRAGAPPLCGTTAPSAVAEGAGGAAGREPGKPARRRPCALTRQRVGAHGRVDRNLRVGSGSASLHGRANGRHRGQHCNANVRHAVVWGDAGARYIRASRDKIQGRVGDGCRGLA